MNPAAQNPGVARRNCIWTLGHSNHSWEDFLAILDSFQIKMLVDVRRYPGSRKFPHFNTDFLNEHLPQLGISYRSLTGLGGRRTPRPDSPNTGWQHESFRGYADYMGSEDFRQALEQLKALSLGGRTAIMCAEALWWQCHRRLIADRLLSEGWQVWNIMAAEKAELHQLIPPAQILNDTLCYP